MTSICGDSSAGVDVSSRLFPFPRPLQVAFTRKHGPGSLPGGSAGTPSSGSDVRLGVFTPKLNRVLAHLNSVASVAAGGGTSQNVRESPRSLPGFPPGRPCACPVACSVACPRMTNIWSQAGLRDSACRATRGQHVNTPTGVSAS